MRAPSSSLSNMQNEICSLYALLENDQRSQVGRSSSGTPDLTLHHPAKDMPSDLQFTVWIHWLG
jgi:hypothetical protein